MIPPHGLTDVAIQRHEPTWYSHPTIHPFFVSKCQSGTGGGLEAMAWGPIRRPPTLDPGIDRLHPDKATQPIKYTSHGLVWVLTPYNTFQHPSLCLPPGGLYRASRPPHTRSRHTLDTVSDPYYPPLDSHTLKSSAMSRLGTLTLLYTPFLCLSVKVDRGGFRCLWYRVQYANPLV